MGPVTARATTGKVVAALAGAALLAVAFLVAGGSSPRPESRTAGAASSEPVLDGSVSPAAPEDPPRRGRRGTAVEILTPGGSAQAGPTDERERVLAENEGLRRQVDHLEALEAERARVSRLLARADVYDSPLVIGAGGLAWPVSGPLVSPFGQRWGRLHAGVDIAAPAGTVIRAAETGGVAVAAPTGGYGNYVCIQHGAGFSTCYAHLSRFMTRRGEVVRQGDPIGLVGCTGHCYGDHVHFETWVNGRPVDPMPYL